MPLAPKCSIYRCVPSALAYMICELVQRDWKLNTLFYIPEFMSSLYSSWSKMVIYISVSMYLYKLKYVFLALNGELLWREIRVIRFSCIFIVLVCYNAPHQRLAKKKKEFPQSLPLSLTLKTFLPPLIDLWALRRRCLIKNIPILVPLIYKHQSFSCTHS